MAHLVLAWARRCGGLRRDSKCSLCHSEGIQPRSSHSWCVSCWLGGCHSWLLSCLPTLPPHGLHRSTPQWPWSEMLERAAARGRKYETLQPSQSRATAGENVETMTPYQYTIVIIVPLSVAH